MTCTPNRMGSCRILRQAVSTVHTVAMATCTTFILGGCVAENDRLTVGHEVELEAFTPDEPRFERLAPTTVSPDKPFPAFPAGDHSVKSMDRSNWTEQTVLVPVDGTAHRPTYAESVELKNSTARQRGEFPTALSALELTGGFTDEQLVETFTTPLVVFGSGVIVPFRLLIDPQWNIHYSPKRTYDRWPTPGSDPIIKAEFAAPADGSDAAPAADPTLPGAQEWPR
ncbi:MAG TPA: hypothetical protein VK176_02510 [Phycisphaerales bacterium]|nr:hypothetical protein [Phycisphaerales bacterium]